MSNLSDDIFCRTIFSAIIYLSGNGTVLERIPLFLDAALVGSVATTSGSSEIGMVERGRERARKRKRQRQGWWLLLRLCVGGEMLQEQQRGANGRGTEGDRGWRRRREDGGEINTLRSPPPGVHG